MNICNVKELKIGYGKPKVCVPIVASTIDEIVSEIVYCNSIETDIIEIRIDFFDGILDDKEIFELCRKINDVKSEKVLLLTYRSKCEGGNIQLTFEQQFTLFETSLQLNTFDIYDIEYRNENVPKLSFLVKEYEKKTILSYHDFNATPSHDEIVSHLQAMESLGGDICKIAVMPQTKKDVLTLLSATITANECMRVPIVTMSMNTDGLISRVAGQIFGSSITFARYKKSSAPGQIDVNQLNCMLDIIDENK